MSPKDGTTIDLTVTSEYDPMSVNNTENELVLTREPIDIPKQNSQPAAATSYYSSYTTITTSTS